MFLGTIFLLAIVLWNYAAANPIIINDSSVRLSFSKRVNETSAKRLLLKDQARAAAFQGRGNKEANRLSSRANAVNIPVTNQAVEYVASVKVGNQANPFSLLVDTGRSNTWVGAGQRYSSTTGTNTTQRVSVTYDTGSFVGTEFTDIFDLGNGLAINQQSFGVAAASKGFSGVDGILGIGPKALTVGTLTQTPTRTIQTITDNLFAQGAIPLNQVSVSFQPTSSLVIANGELTFGGVDNSQFTGLISFVPLTSTSPANLFWGIDQNITYGTAHSTILSETAGIVDTGTTLTLISTDVFQHYKQATGASNDQATGLLKLMTTNFANLQSLNFNIGSTTFELTANAQAWPRALNAATVPFRP